MDHGLFLAALRTLYCLQASTAVRASRIEGDEGERKVVRNMWKILRQPSHADINVMPK
jgi:hypothetical protein